jgi:hypothetical protein
MTLAKLFDSMYFLLVAASSVCMMIMYPPSPRFFSNLPAVVSVLKGATTSIMSPPMATDKGQLSYHLQEMTAGKVIPRKFFKPH